MKRATPLYRDIEIAHAFHKWPHEFWQLSKQEQTLLRDWFILYNHKQIYYQMPEKRRNRWPSSLSDT